MTMKCAYCGKGLLSEEAKRLGYCNFKCHDKDKSSEKGKTNVATEVEKLMEQYNSGGWKP